MAEYRKLHDQDTWHWCRNCSNDPKSGYEQDPGSGRPGSGELCDECKAKEDNGECNN